MNSVIVKLSLETVRINLDTPEGTWNYHRQPLLRPGPPQTPARITVLSEFDSGRYSIGYFLNNPMDRVTVD